MDRRTLLAVVLATLVLVGFQILYPQKPTPRAPEQAADRTPAATSIEAPPSSKESEAAHAIPTDFPATSDSLAAPLVLATDHYRALLTPQGGVLREWRLLGYTDAKEQPADLVAASDRGLFRLAIVGPEGVTDLSGISYHVEDHATDKGGATLVAHGSNGQTVRLRWSFPATGYDARLAVSIEGVDNTRGDKNLELAFLDGLPVLERTPQQDQMSAASSAMVGKQVIRHLRSHGGFGGCGGNPAPFEILEPGVVHWIGTESKYFLAAAIPDGAPDATTVFRRVRTGGPVEVAIRLPLSLDGPTERAFTVYAGPLDFHRLESYGVGLENAVQLGYRVFRPLTQLLLRFFQGVYHVIPNYGMVIIVLSVLLKVLFYPLTRKSLESMSQMQRLKPEIDRLSEKFKDDPQRRNQAMFELYKTHKVNPMGGCLPLLLQMPVFIGLYSVFSSAIELRKAPFALWITDLSAPDRVGAILGQPIHILPLLMAGTSLLQAKLTPSAPNQASMTYLMPLITTMIFYGLPSGLVLYWTVTNIIQIGQQVMMNRSVPKASAAA